MHQRCKRSLFTSNQKVRIFPHLCEEKKKKKNNAEVIANNGFIVLAYELWFKQILWELDSVRVIFQNGHVSQVNIHSGKIRTPLSLHLSLMYVSYIHFYLFIFLVEQPKEKIH